MPALLSFKWRLGLAAALVCMGCAAASTVLWRVDGPAHAANVPPVTQEFGHQKIIYHIAEAGDDKLGRQAGWLGSMLNHYAALQPGALDLAVVMNGDGIALLTRARTDKELQSRIDKLKKLGARFYVCRNTLVSRGLDPDTDLYDVKRGDIVAAGVAEVALLESQGYGYLRP